MHVTKVGNKNVRMYPGLEGCSATGEGGRKFKNKELGVYENESDGTHAVGLSIVCVAVSLVIYGFIGYEAVQHYLHT